jgi:hypothetical protein
MQNSNHDRSDPPTHIDAVQCSAVQCSEVQDPIQGLAAPDLYNLDQAMAVVTIYFPGANRFIQSVRRQSTIEKEIREGLDRVSGAH